MIRLPRAQRLSIFALVTAAALSVAPAASAHIERSSYWPMNGGSVPAPRTLASAVVDARLAPGVRVVCQADSLARARAAIAAAQTTGVLVRPTEPRTVMSAADAGDLLRINEVLAANCLYSEIQPAVNDTTNGGRVVVMPGLYTEPTSRSKPTHDPACAPYKITNERGDTNAVSYDYQYYCPNDANLIAIIGRAPDTAPPPNPPLVDRHGIPNEGACIRCNVQLEGSGPGADDVVIDAGDTSKGNAAQAQGGAVKDVGIRADRADGFVLRNVTVRHAQEHDVYVLETDGYLLDRFKTFYAGEYGVLTFVEDHGLIQNCEAMGNGDSGLYPGAGADTGADRDPAADKVFHTYAVARYSQEIRYCDSHHNAGGYSGTDGNATHVDHNNFYDNALGFTTDVFTAPGHPGFPQDSDLIEYNNFYSNNFNVYADSSDVHPSIPVPVGTGLWIAGGNSNVLRDNRFYDNWRRAAMLFAVPDVVVCGPSPVGTPVTGCDSKKLSTSYDNRFYDNIMGVDPNGVSQPNGQDFWWDDFASNTGNCWWGNHTGDPLGRLHDSPATLPTCLDGTQPQLSVGTGYAPNQAELTGCLAVIATGAAWRSGAPTCPWFDTPKQPGTTAPLR